MTGGLLEPSDPFFTQLQCTIQRLLRSRRTTNKIQFKVGHRIDGIIHDTETTCYSGGPVSPVEEFCELVVVESIHILARWCACRILHLFLKNWSPSFGEFGATSLYSTNIIWLARGNPIRALERKNCKCPTIAIDEPGGRLLAITLSWERSTRSPSFHWSAFKSDAWTTAPLTSNESSFLHCRVWTFVCANLF